MKPEIVLFLCACVLSVLLQGKCRFCRSNFILYVIGKRFIELSVSLLIFWVVTPCVDTNASEEHTASIFMAETLVSTKTLRYNVQ
jgi:hypothetical protein